VYVENPKGRPETKCWIPATQSEQGFVHLCIIYQPFGWQTASLMPSSVCVIGSRVRWWDRERKGEAELWEENCGVLRSPALSLSLVLVVLFLLPLAYIAILILKYRV
jgi:hypothetical protein